MPVVCYDLKPGAELPIPEGVQFRISKNAMDFPATPHYAVLRRHKVEREVTFKTSFDDFLEEREWGRVLLFLPENIKVGDRVVVQWAEGDCACAMRG